jgi:hypothetical protein
MRLIRREIQRRGKNYKRHDPKAYIIELLPERFFVIREQALDIGIGRISILCELIDILKVRTRDL